MTLANTLAAQRQQRFVIFFKSFIKLYLKMVSEDEVEAISQKSLSQQGVNPQPEPVLQDRTPTDG